MLGKCNRGRRQTGKSVIASAEQKSIRQKDTGACDRGSRLLLATYIPVILIVPYFQGIAINRIRDSTSVPSFGESALDTTHVLIDYTRSAHLLNLSFVLDA